MDALGTEVTIQYPRTGLIQWESELLGVMPIGTDPDCLGMLAQKKTELSLSLFSRRELFFYMTMKYTSSRCTA